MRYFMDTEFSHFHERVALVSIGIVTETPLESGGGELHLINSELVEAELDPWVVENVLPLLPPRDDPAWATRAEMARRIEAFVSEHGIGEFWAYNASYDWVALTGLWGRLVDRPAGWPSGVRDIKELRHGLEVLTGKVVELPGAPETPHNALSDARWDRDVWLWLRERLGKSLNERP